MYMYIRNTGKVRLANVHGTIKLNTFILLDGTLRDSFSYSQKLTGSETFCFHSSYTYAVYVKEN
jgi:hypothetical protein